MFNILTRYRGVNQKISPRRKSKRVSPRKIRKSKRVSPRKSKRVSPRKIRKSKRASSRKSKKRKSRIQLNGDHLSKYHDIEPLTIYTQEGCPACIKVKEVCNTNNIKFNILILKDQSEEERKKINNRTNNYSYVPVIFDKHYKFLGGVPELQKIIENKMKK